MKNHIDSLNSDELSLPLSVALRQSTAQAHDEAENSRFMGMVFSGRATPLQYRWYLEALLHVYNRLETELRRQKAHPAIELIYFEELFRVEAIRKDLTYWRQGSQPLLPTLIEEAAKAYCLRIEGVSNKQPELLVAHSYVRYLGDLSGGQALAHAMTKAGVSAEGLNFYHFGDINKVQFKNQYRANLDKVGERYSHDKSNFCGEANLVFRLNSNLFKAFDQIEEIK